MKWNDPIVEEVRATREQLLQEAGGFEAYIKRLRTQELEHPQRLLSKEDLESTDPIPSRDNPNFSGRTAVHIASDYGLRRWV